MTLDDLKISHHFVGRDYAKVTEIERGMKLAQHTHLFEHHAVLLIGIAQVEAAGVKTTHHAPAIVTIPAEVPHEISALSDCLWVCLWPNPLQERDPEKIDAKVIRHG